jgi:hypothetical protein
MRNRRKKHHHRRKQTPRIVRQLARLIRLLIRYLRSQNEGRLLRKAIATIEKQDKGARRP